MLCIASVANSFGQGEMAGMEQFNNFKLVKYYDNLSETVLPLCLVEYYEGLTDSGIDRIEQVIDRPKQERQICIYTTAVSRGYLFMTRRLSAIILNDHHIKRIEWLINGKPLTSNNIRYLLSVKRRDVRTATCEEVEDTIIVRINYVRQ